MRNAHVTNKPKITNIFDTFDLVHSLGQAHFEKQKDSSVGLSRLFRNTKIVIGG